MYQGIGCSRPVGVLYCCTVPGISVTAAVYLLPPNCFWASYYNSSNTICWRILPFCQLPPALPALHPIGIATHAVNQTKNRPSRSILQTNQDLANTCHSLVQRTTTDYSRVRSRSLVIEHVSWRSSRIVTDGYFRKNHRDGLLLYNRNYYW